MVRNGWLNASIRGRKTPATGGPRRKEDGFTLQVYQRDTGLSVSALEIEGVVIGTELELSVWDFTSDPVKLVWCKRFTR